MKALDHVLLVHGGNGAAPLVVTAAVGGTNIGGDANGAEGALLVTAAQALAAFGGNGASGGTGGTVGDGALYPF